jgi:cell division protein FtsI/penicillin-binding protein 2
MQKRKAAAEQAKAEAQAQAKEQAEQAKSGQTVQVDPQNGEIQADANDRLKIERI